MSGYKRATVTISEEEYRRLHEADVRRRFRDPTNVRAIKSPNRDATLSNALRQIENRQRQLQEAMNGMDQSLDQIEAATMQAILSQNASYYESLEAIIEETASDTHDSVAALSQQITERMQREREHHLRELRTLARKYDAYAQKEHRKEQAARQWLRQSGMLADLIQQHFAHERFLPGRLRRILQGLEVAQDNLAQGFHEASLQVSQQAFLELSELQLELEQCLLEWQVEYENACSAFKQALANLVANSQVNAMGLQGEELIERVDLDYWTNGKYRQLLEECRQVLELLALEQQWISTAELRRLNTETLPAITRFLESIIYEARFKALNSQLRMNIAERALQALENHGFILAGAGYESEDMRAPFIAQLTNSDGSRVTIQVLPTNDIDRELTNDLVVVTEHPSIKTAQEARLQWEALCKTLTRHNFRVGHPDIRSARSTDTTDQTDSLRLLPLQRPEPERQKDVR
ncbi:MAG: hypothetical protein ACOYZ8_07745 [Chloroflexota bacterium]